METDRPLRCGPGGEGGFGMVEVMASVMIMMVALLSLASVMGNSLRSLQSSRQRQTAVALATRSVESARTYGYTSLAMRSGTADVPGSPWDPDGTGSLAAEPVVATATGLVTGTPHFVTPATVAQPRVATYVTWVDDPHSSMPSSSDAKRVTAVATWVNGGVTREVRISTLIADIR